MRAAAECGDMLSALGTAMAERREPPRPDAARVHVRHSSREPRSNFVPADRMDPPPRNYERIDRVDLEMIWEMERRVQATSPGIRITTEVYERYEERWVPYAVNMEQCVQGWEEQRADPHHIPHFVIRFDERYRQWMCDRVHLDRV